MRVAAISVLLTACLSASALAAVHSVRGPFHEPGLAFRKADLDNGKLPDRILLAPVPATFSSQLKFSCLGVQAASNEILVFLAHSGDCLPLGDARTSAAMTQADLDSNPVSRETATREINKQLASQSVVLVLPDTAETQAAQTCYCPPDPGNTKPSVSVSSGSPQTVMAGSAISAIEFGASDDNVALSYSFTYTLDGGAWQDGLPAGLSQLCSHVAYSVSCEVTGLAPATTGDYQIRLGVSDGTLTGYAAALLTVTPFVPPEIIFGDGFENSP